MTKLLTLDDMREIITKIDSQAGRRLAAHLEHVANQMAAHIAAEFDLACSTASTDYEEGGGTGCFFYLSQPDQETPEALKGYDPDEPLDYLDDPNIEINEEDRDAMRAGTAVLADTVYRAEFCGHNGRTFAAVYSSLDKLMASAQRRFSGGLWVSAHVQKVERHLGTWNTQERVVETFPLHAGGEHATGQACA